MYSALIIVSRFISKAYTVPTAGSEVRAPMPKSLKKDLPLLCDD